jgi:hypothetical protein
MQFQFTGFLFPGTTLRCKNFVILFYGKKEGCFTWRQIFFLKRSTSHAGQLSRSIHLNQELAGFKNNLGMTEKHEYRKEKKDTKPGGYFPGIFHNASKNFPR